MISDPQSDKELQETELGPLPSTWKVGALQDFQVTSQYGISQRGRDQGKYAIIGMNNLEDGQIIFDDLQYLDLDDDTFEKFELRSGDVLFNRTNSHDLVGKTSIFQGGRNFVFASYLVRLQTDRQNLDPDFLNFYMNWGVSQRRLKMLATRGVSQSNISASQVRTFVIAAPPPQEQREIVRVLSTIHRAQQATRRVLECSVDSKRTVAHRLFSHGLHGEPQKETEIGFIPVSWTPTKMGQCCEIVTSSISYEDFLRMPADNGANGEDCMGIKVSDMNLPGNERQLITANLIKRISIDLAHRKLVPPNTVVFPKRGAAIATNKKRLTTKWTVLDPNLIGVRGGNEFDAEFLFYWSQLFDLRTITSPGPTPQLNKKDLIPVLIPLPSDPNEQHEIVVGLSAMDRKIVAEQEILRNLEELFNSLLANLMTGKISASLQREPTYA